MKSILKKNMIKSLIYGCMLLGGELHMEASLDRDVKEASSDGDLFFLVKTPKGKNISFALDENATIKDLKEKFVDEFEKNDHCSNREKQNRKNKYYFISEGKELKDEDPISDNLPTPSHTLEAQLRTKEPEETKVKLVIEVRAREEETIYEIKKKAGISADIPLSYHINEDEYKFLEDGDTLSGVLDDIFDNVGEEATRSVEIFYDKDQLPAAHERLKAEKQCYTILSGSTFTIIVIQNIYLWRKKHKDAKNRLKKAKKQKRRKKRRRSL